MILRQKEDF